jgi:hypothetical protein
MVFSSFARHNHGDAIGIPVFGQSSAGQVGVSRSGYECKPVAGVAHVFFIAFFSGHVALAMA